MFVFVYCICIFVFLFVYFYPAPGVIIGLAPYLEEGRVELAFPLFSLPPSDIHHLQRPLKIFIAPSCLIFIFVELSSLSSFFFLDQQSNGYLGVFWFQLEWQRSE